MTKLIDSMYNREKEKIEIRKIDNGPHNGEYLLVICDDPEVSDTCALHLLDAGTIDWLMMNLSAIRRHVSK